MKKITSLVKQQRAEEEKAGIYVSSPTNVAIPSNNGRELTSREKYDICELAAKGDVEQLEKMHHDHVFK